VCLGQVLIFGDEKYKVILEIPSKMILDSAPDTFGLTNIYSGLVTQDQPRLENRHRDLMIHYVPKLYRTHFLDRQLLYPCQFESSAVLNLLGSPHAKNIFNVAVAIIIFAKGSIG